MRSNVVGLVAAAALFASVGIANAKTPLKLTDGQLDNITAGASPTSAALAANVATAGALNYAGAVNTAVAANLAAAVDPFAVGTAVAANLGAAAAFNNLLAASTAAATIAATP
jgi:hypothetical protein